MAGGLNDDWVPQECHYSVSTVPPEPAWVG